MKYLWYIPVFLCGMLVDTIIIYRMVTPQMWWAKQYPQEVDWAKARYELYQKAAKQLYFDTSDAGITIVRPTKAQ